MDTNERVTHCNHVIDAIRRGRVVPFLGAGVNLCDRPSRDRTAAAEADWRWSGPDAQYLPTGAELAGHLARKFYFHGVAGCAIPGCHDPQHSLELPKVSQFADTALGGGRLREELRAVFAKPYPPTSAHRLLASLPWPAPEALRPEDRYPLIVTTNYDDLMEKALAEKQLFDLVYYQLSDEQYRAGFWHIPPTGGAVPILDANSYSYPFCQERPVILKIHGTIGRADQDQDGYVITEDHYIEFMADEVLSHLLPATLLGKVRNNHLLFLGYSLKDWNLRVFLHRLKRNPNKAYHSWAVLIDTDAEEREFWTKNGVKIIDMPLNQYVGMLAQKLQSATPPLPG